MSKQLMEVVLPRLARRLYHHLQNYRAGQLNDRQFTKKFEALLQKQFDWLAQRGVPEERAAVAIHGAVLVLSGPGLRAEAEEEKLPLEVVEFRAVQAAAQEIAAHYDISQRQAIHQIAAIVAFYGE